MTTQSSPPNLKSNLKSIVTRSIQKLDAFFSPVFSSFCRALVHSGAMITALNIIASAGSPLALQALVTGGHVDWRGILAAVIAALWANRALFTIPPIPALSDSWRVNIKIALAAAIPIVLQGITAGRIDWRGLVAAAVSAVIHNLATFATPPNTGGW